ncbi:hypothetical protein D3C73_1618070 [compost metagenome]
MDPAPIELIAVNVRVLDLVRYFIANLKAAGLTILRSHIYEYIPILGNRGILIAGDAFDDSVLYNDRFFSCKA